MGERGENSLLQKFFQPVPRDFIAFLLFSVMNMLDMILQDALLSES